MRNTLPTVMATFLLTLGGCASQTTKAAHEHAEAANPTNSAEGKASNQTTVKEVKPKSVLMATADNTPKAIEVSKPTISAEAQATLSLAQAAVKEAKAKGALWTTADNALKAAEAAVAKGDSEGVIKNANIAIDHVRMGLEQTKYPVLQLKDL